ncbi:MAG: type III secretion system inner membrane ring subunit SctD [Dongiaceae bacterium]
MSSGWGGSVLQARRAGKSDAERRDAASEERAGGEVVTIRRRPAGAEGGDPPAAASTSPAPARFLLKCLSGPNLGAEAVLPEGEFTIGSSDDCDVVLSDRAVAALHLRARAGDDGVTLLELPGIVLDEAGKALAQGSVVPLLALLLLGTTYLQIGRRDQPWPSARAPQELPAAAEPAAPTPAGDAAPATSPEASKVEASNAEAPKAEASKAEASMAAPEPEAARAPLPVSRPPRRHLTVIVGAGLLLLLVLLVAVGAYLLGSAAEETVAAAPPPTLQERAATLLADEGLDSGVAALAAPDGRVSIAGYVRSAEQRRRLVQAVRSAKLPVGIEVWSEDTLAATAREELNAAGFDLAVTPLGLGRLRLQGYVGAADGLQRAIDGLRQDVAGIQDIENRVLTPVLAAEALRRLLAEQGLADRLTLKAGPGGLAVSGTLTDAEEPRWQAAAAAFTAAYGQAPRIMTAIATRPLSADLALRSIVVGPTSFITLGDGKRYRTGDSVSGYRVEAIAANQVTLSRDGVRYLQEIGP